MLTERPGRLRGGEGAGAPGLPAEQHERLHSEDAARAPGQGSPVSVLQRQLRQILLGIRIEINFISRVG